jgi:hypothetical protein
VGKLTNLHPVYEFRPLPDFFSRHGEIYRFGDGEWVPDDGEYDLAFVGGNTCLMVELPYQKNIIWSWLSGHWSSNESRHGGGNPWHYMLRDGETGWGGGWGREQHPNAKAGRSGLFWACSKHSCANGRHVEFRLSDKHIAAGLVRERDSKRILTFPENLCCMYCGDAGRSALAASIDTKGIDDDNRI